MLEKEMENIPKEVFELLETLSDRRKWTTLHYLFYKERETPIGIEEIAEDLGISGKELKTFEKEILRPLSHEVLINLTYIRNKDGKATDAYWIADLGKSMVLHLYGEFLPPFNDDLDERLVKSYKL